MENSLEVRSKGLCGFIHLWLHHEVAVALIWILGEEVLVVVLAHPKFL